MVLVEGRGGRLRCRVSVDGSVGVVLDRLLEGLCNICKKTHCSNSRNVLLLVSLASSLTSRKNRVKMSRRLLDIQASKVTV